MTTATISTTTMTAGFELEVMELTWASATEAIFWPAAGSSRFVPESAGAMSTPSSPLGALTLRERRRRLSQRARRRTANAARYPDTPEQIAEREATIGAFMPGQDESLRDL